MVVRVAPLSFDVQCKAAGLPVPVPELRFHPVRRWRWDWAWKGNLLALEVQGAVFVQGRHSRGASMMKDFEKFNHGAIAGWRVLFCVPRQIANGEALAIVEAALRQEQSA